MYFFFLKSTPNEQSLTNNLPFCAWKHSKHSVVNSLPPSDPYSRDMVKTVQMPESFFFSCLKARGFGRPISRPLLQQFTMQRKLISVGISLPKLYAFQGQQVQCSRNRPSLQRCTWKSFEQTTSNFFKSPVSFSFIVVLH